MYSAGLRVLLLGAGVTQHEVCVFLVLGGGLWVRLCVALLCADTRSVSWCVFSDLSLGHGVCISAAMKAPSADGRSPLRLRERQSHSGALVCVFHAEARADTESLTRRHGSTTAALGPSVGTVAPLLWLRVRWARLHEHARVLQSSIVIALSHGSLQVTERQLQATSLSFLRMWRHKKNFMSSL